MPTRPVRSFLAIVILLGLPSCIGATLEYGDPLAVQPDAEVEEGDDGGAEPEAIEAPEPAAPVDLDIAVLDRAASDAGSLGLEATRVGDQTLYATLPVYFAHNTATLLPEAEPALEAARLLLEGAPRITTAQIAAHSDSRGMDAYNSRLSAARAYAIALWLVERGIACDRLEAVGYGEQRPIADNMTAGGRAMNRRVELWVLGVDGSTVLGTNGTVFGDPCNPSVDPDTLLCGESCD